MKQIEASGNKTLIHILRRASMNSTNPEFGELSNYNITYGTVQKLFLSSTKSLIKKDFLRFNCTMCHNCWINSGQSCHLGSCPPLPSTKHCVTNKPCNLIKRCNTNLFLFFVCRKLAKDQSVAEENVPLQETPGPSEEKAGTPV